MVPLADRHDDRPRSANDERFLSIHDRDVPTTEDMAAPRHLSSDDTARPHLGASRRRNWLLGLTPPAGGTPKGVPDVATLADEVEDLTERLAVAERRAREAEMALPHLLGLGQRTVNGLLNDARARGRQIIDAAREQAVAEMGAEREAMRREARDLEALRMAVAAEAMGLEEIRAELQRRISMSAAEMARVAAHPQLMGQPLPLAEHGIGPVPAAAIASSQVSVPPPAELDVVDPGDVAHGVGLVEASLMPAHSVEAQLAIAGAMEATAVEHDTVDAGLVLDPDVALDDAAVVAAAVVADDREDGPVADLTDTGLAAAGVTTPDAAGTVEATAHFSSGGFADAWAEDEDEAVAEAFDRFFSADVDSEPSRDWILADDTKP